MEMDMESALPSDVQDLYDALIMAEHGEEILPPTLADVPGMNLRDIRPHMWQQMDKAINTQSTKTGAQPSDCSVADKHHHRILGIVKLSNESFNMHRSEAAWDTMVHYPLLYELTSFSSVRVEPITSAQIVPAFRPSFSGQPYDDASSQTGSSFSAMGSVSGYDSDVPPSRRNATKLVHEMVNFALTLAPDEDLAALIETFTKSSPTGTVNQTAYYPLKSRPAPVFIKTITSAGNIEAAKVQLGVCIAAWHKSIRSIMRRGGDEERIITVPIILVVNGAWTLMFAVDAQTEILILDRDFRIGSSNTIRGMYQLQAALSAIVVWIEGEF